MSKCNLQCRQRKIIQLESEERCPAHPEAPLGILGHWQHEYRYFINRSKKSVPQMRSLIAEDSVSFLEMFCCFHTGTALDAVCFTYSPALVCFHTQHSLE